MWFANSGQKRCYPPLVRRCQFCPWTQNARTAGGGLWTASIDKNPLKLSVFWKPLRVCLANVFCPKRVSFWNRCQKVSDSPFKILMAISAILTNRLFFRKVRIRVGVCGFVYPFPQLQPPLCPTTKPWLTAPPPWRENNRETSDKHLPKITRFAKKKWWACLPVTFCKKKPIKISQNGLFCSLEYIWRVFPDVFQFHIDARFIPTKQNNITV